MLSSSKPVAVESSSEPSKHLRSSLLAFSQKTSNTVKIKIKRMSRYKCRSGTNHISHSPQTPNMMVLLQCLARVFLREIHTKQVPHTDQDPIFSEECYPLDPSVEISKTLTEATILNFMGMIIQDRHLTAEIIVMVVAYVDRIKKYSDLTLNYANWRRVILEAMLLAEKIWEDETVWNIDLILTSFPYLGISDLNSLELKFLTAVEFDVTLTATDYIKYYFALTALSKDKNLINLRPNKQQACLLETKSREMEQKQKSKHKKRSSSLSNITLDDSLVEQFRKYHTEKLALSDLK